MQSWIKHYIIGTLRRSRQTHEPYSLQEITDPHCSYPYTGSIVMKYQQIHIWPLIVHPIWALILLDSSQKKTGNPVEIGEFHGRGKTDKNKERSEI